VLICVHLWFLLLAAAAPRWTFMAPIHPAPDNVKRLLVIRQSALGDIINALYTIRPLRRAFPAARIAWLVDDRFRDLFDAVDGIDEVIVFPRRRWGRWLARPWRWPQLAWEWARYARDLRERRFDLVIDLQNNAKSRWSRKAVAATFQIEYDRGIASGLPDRSADIGSDAEPSGQRLRAAQFLSLLQRAGIEPAPGPFPWKIPGEADHAAEAYLNLEGLGEKAFAILHPGSSSFGVYKRWPAERFASLAARLAGRGMPVVVTWGPGEKSLAESVAAAAAREMAVGQPGAAKVTIAIETRPLPVLVALLKRAAVFVGNDSGPLHVASACGTPTVGLYGPKDPGLYAPYTEPRAILYHPLPCSPCGRRRCDNPECMKAISADRVHDRICSLLGNRVDRPVAGLPLRGGKRPWRLPVDAPPPKPGPFRHFSVGAWRWTAMAEAAGPLAVAAMRSAEGLPGDTLHANPRRRFLRLRLHRLDASGAPAASAGARNVFIKVYTIRGIGPRLRAWLGFSQADVEFHRLVRLHDAGAPVPAPIALGDGPGAKALVLEDLGDATTLRALLDRGAGRPALRPLLEAAADAASALHDAGFIHADLHVGNILRLPDGALRVVDVHRGRDAARPVLEARAVTLAHLCFSLSTFVGVVDRVRLLRRYAERSGQGRAAFRPLVGAVDGAYARLRRRYALGQMARARRGSSRIWVGAWKGGSARTAFGAKDWLDEPETIEAVLKDEAGRRLLRVRKGGHLLAVKEETRRRRGALGWAGSHGLLACGLPTPRPFFLLEPPRGPVRLATEWIDGVEPLGAYLEKRLEGGATPTWRREAAWRIGRFVRRFHAAGVYHADFKAGNVLARDGAGGGPELFALDLDRVDFHAGPVPLDRALANLAQLNAAVAGPVTRADRLRGFFAYAARDRDLRRDWKTGAREIMRRTIARRHRWP
jgi:heptosyltransferase-1